MNRIPSILLNSILAILVLGESLLTWAGSPSRRPQREGPGETTSIFLPLVLKNYQSIYKVAFISDRDGNNEIYVINSDGANQIRLTNNTSADDMPNWSPDGLRIVFASAQDGQYEIYRVDADGNNLTRLTNNLSNEYYPDWSPNGQKIAYVSAGQGSSNEGIYTMNMDGTGKTRLIYSSNDQYTTWSPDGNKIAYVAGGEITIINATGSDPTKITSKTDQYAYDMDWSPDGSQIVFRGEVCAPGCKQDIYVVNVDGSGLSRLTNGTGVNLYPEWSPTGTKIAYTCNFHICSMDANGTNVFPLTSGPASDNRPSWSHAGDKIAFSTNLNGNYEIYLINPDGSGLTRLTTSTGDNFNPIWQP